MKESSPSSKGSIPYLNHPLLVEEEEKKQEDEVDSKSKLYTKKNGKSVILACIGQILIDI